MATRVRKTRLEPLGSILPGVLKRNKLAVSLEDRRLRNLWDKAVGPQIAAQTRPVEVKKGVLYVKVFTSVWLQQLNFLQEELLEKVSLSFGEYFVKKLHFSLGERAVPGCPGRSIETLPLDLRYLRPRDWQMIEESLLAIASEELREIIRRVMVREMVRRRMMEGKSSPGRFRAKP